MSVTLKNGIAVIEDSISTKYIDLEKVEALDNLVFDSDDETMFEFEIKLNGRYVIASYTTEAQAKADVKTLIEGWMLSIHQRKWLFRNVVKDTRFKSLLNELGDL